MLHGRKCPAFKINPHNHLLSLCFLGDYERTKLLALSKSPRNLTLLRCACCFVSAMHRSQNASSTLGTAELESESREELPQEKQHIQSLDKNHKPTYLPANRSQHTVFL